MACSTIIKMAIVLKTLRGCSQDSCGQKRLQPEAMRLQNHGPGLEKTGEKANLGHRMACSAINKIGIVLETLRGCSRDSCGPKRLQPEAIRLQNHGPGLEKKLGEKRTWATEWPAAPSIKWGLSFKHRASLFGLLTLYNLTYFQ